MIVAGFVPALNWAIAWTISAAGLPARPATVEPGAGLPLVPWHMAQADAIDCTPLGDRLEGAKLGAGCCASAMPAAMAVAAVPARVLATVLFMEVFSVRDWASKKDSTPMGKRPREAGVFARLARPGLRGFHGLGRLSVGLRDFQRD